MKEGGKEKEGKKKGEESSLLESVLQSKYCESILHLVYMPMKLFLQKTWMKVLAE